MLNTSSQANFKPALEIDDLEALAKAIREHHWASTNATQTFLQNAIDCGDALNRAKAQIEHGCWADWLKKSCNLNERTAQRYMRLAEHRAEFKSDTVSDLSMTAILKGIAKPKSTNSAPAKKTKSATGFEASYFRWHSASQKERSDFLECVGIKPRLGQASLHVTTQLKLALSTSNEGEAGAALSEIKRVIAAGKYDLDDVELHLINKHRRRLCRAA